MGMDSIDDDGGWAARGFAGGGRRFLLTRFVVGPTRSTRSFRFIRRTESRHGRLSIRTRPAAIADRAAVQVMRSRDLMTAAKVRPTSEGVMTIGLGVTAEGQTPERPRAPAAETR
jgi:hypothetical protein